MRRHWWCRALALVPIALFGCASNDGPGPGPDDPSVRLETLIGAWQAEREDGGSCATGGSKYPFVDCGRVQAAIEGLALEFPANSQVLLVNAVVAFETHQPEKAQSYLDAVIEQEQARPAVIVLRSRLALQQGNAPHARRLLMEQVTIAPDAPELREALASIHYLAGEFDLARRELTIAERLGSPAWRVFYNRGLLAEAEGRPEAAIEHYRSALEQNAAYAPARSRLRGLESERGL